jgi:hypothetical protein
MNVTFFSHPLQKMYVTNLVEQRRLKALMVPLLVNIVPAFYGTRKFITVFRTARQLSYLESH